MKSIIKQFNKSTIIPISLGIVIYLLSYRIPKIILPYESLHFVSLPIDDLIPLFTPAVIIYIPAFGQWIYAIYVLFKQDTKIGYWFAEAITIGSLIGFITFIVYPTAVDRPVIDVKNIFDWVLNNVYTTDNIINACPSYHCFCSTISVMILERSKGVSKKTIYFNILYAILVYISTVLTKQHYIIDIPFGILLAIISVLLAKNGFLSKFYDSLNNRFMFSE